MKAIIYCESGEQFTLNELMGADIFSGLKEVEGDPDTGPCLILGMNKPLTTKEDHSEDPEAKLIAPGIFLTRGNCGDYDVTIERPFKGKIEITF